MTAPITDRDAALRLRNAIRLDLTRGGGPDVCATEEEGRVLYESRVAPELRGLWSEP